MDGSEMAEMTGRGSPHEAESVYEASKEHSG